MSSRQQSTLHVELLINRLWICLWYLWHYINYYSLTYGPLSPSSIMWPTCSDAFWLTDNRRPGKSNGGRHSGAQQFTGAELATIVPPKTHFVTKYCGRYTEQFFLPSSSHCCNIFAGSSFFPVPIKLPFHFWANGQLVGYVLITQ